MTALDFKTWLLEQKDTIQKCYYFGSFNPIHNDHISNAVATKNQYGFEVIFVPTPQSPEKNPRDLAPFEDRVQMCRIAGNKYGFAVDDVEGKMPQPNYTIKTIDKLYPDKHVKIPFLVGTDQILNFHKWVEAPELAKRLVLIMANRNSLPVNNQNIHLDIRPLHATTRGISATQIRMAIREGQDITDLVPLEVAEYIKHKDLYR
jgi:nicotinate-nucleotide adenylyltransferase